MNQVSYHFFKRTVKAGCAGFEGRSLRVAESGAAAGARLTESPGPPPFRRLAQPLARLHCRVPGVVACPIRGYAPPRSSARQDMTRFAPLGLRSFLLFPPPLRVIRSPARQRDSFRPSGGFTRFCCFRRPFG